jgi:hypothetical protein
MGSNNELEDFRGILISNIKQCHLKIKDSRFKCGEYLTLPKNTPVWSISAQTMILFQEEEIVEITSTVWSGDYYYGKLKQVLFNCPGFIPGIIDKGGNFEIGFSDSESLVKYEVPKPTFITYNYTTK